MKGEKVLSTFITEILAPSEFSPASIISTIMYGVDEKINRIGSPPNVLRITGTVIDAVTVPPQ